MIINNGFFLIMENGIINMANNISAWRSILSNKAVLSEFIIVLCKSLSPIEANSAHEAGLSPKNMLFNQLQVLNLLISLINVIVIMNGAVTIANVEITDPIIPAVV